MSYRLPQIDMSTFAVGKSGQIVLNDVINKTAYNPSHATDPAHIRIFNDSGSALSIASDDGSIQDYIPAGAWPVYELGQTTKLIDFTVLAILPNPPIQLLMPTYYIPGEVVPDSPTLGNSPIGIGGTIQTSSVQTLSQEGQARVFLTIDIGDSVLAQLITINNDGTAVFKVDVGGVAHQVLQFLSSGNLVKVGQSGDITEILGNELVDGTLTVTGDAILNGAGTGEAVANNMTVGGTLAVTGAETLTGNLNVSGQIAFQTAANAKIVGTGGGLPIDATSGTNVFINPAANGAGNKIGFATNAVERFEVNDGGAALIAGALSLLVGSMARVAGNDATTAGSGTVITHGLGGTPHEVLATPNIAQPGSATIGVGAIGATTFTVTVGAGTAVDWRCTS